MQLFLYFFDKFNQIKEGIHLFDDTFLSLELIIQNSNTSWTEPEWGFPKGRRNNNELALDCAIREFKEETGYEAKKMTPLLTFYPLIGYTTQKVHCFVATGIRNTGMQKLDKDEFLHVVKINIKDAIKLIQSEQIVDSISVCAILYYIFKKRLQI